MNKKTKLLLAGGVAGFVLLIGVILLTLWFTLWMPPSKNDFAAAKKTAEKVKEYKALDQLRKFASLTADQSQAGKSQQQLVDAVSNDRKKVIELAEKRHAVVHELHASKAVRDGEVKKAFDDYAAAEARYQKYLYDFSEVYPSYRSSLVTCQAVYRVAREVKTFKELPAAHKAASKNCLSDLDKLEKSPLPYADYGKKFKAIIAGRQAVFDEVGKGTLKTTEASPRLQKLSQDYSKISPSKAVVDYGNKALIHDELKKLIDVLAKKAK